MRSLVRAQLRLALVAASGFLLILAGIPLLLAQVPALNLVTVLTIPLPWLVLGVLIYPVIVLTAWLYVRNAARNEARFLSLIGESDDNERTGRP